MTSSAASHQGVMFLVDLWGALMSSIFICHQSTHKHTLCVKLILNPVNPEAILIIWSKSLERKEF